MNLDPLGVIFMAKDLASATIGKLEQQFAGLDRTVASTAKNFGAGLALMGTAMATMGFGAGILSPLTHGVEHAVHFQEALARTANIAGITDEKMTELGGDIRQLAAAFDFDPHQVVEGLGEIISAGFNAAEAMKMIDKALLFQQATHGKLTIEAASATMIGSLRGFGMEASRAGEVVDKLVAATNSTSLKFDELALSIGTVSSDAQLANQSFETTLAMLGALRDTGLTALRSSEYIRHGLQHMISPKALEMASSLGVALRDPAGKMRDMIDIIADLEPKLESLGQLQKEAAIKAIFGMHSMAVYGAVVRSTFAKTPDGEIKRGTASLKAMVDAIANSAGVAKAQFERFKETVVGSWAAVRANLSGILLSLGVPLIGALSHITVGFMHLTRAINSFLVENPRFAEFVGTVLGFVGSFFLVVGAIIAVKGALMALGGLLAIVGIKVSMLGLVFAQAALMAAGLAAAAALIAKAWQANFGGIASFFKGVWDKVSSFFGAIVQFFSKGEISEAMYDSLVDSGMLEFVEAALRVWFKLKAFLGGVLDGFTAAVEKLEPIARAVWEGAKEALSSFGDAVLDVIAFFDELTGGVGDQRIAWSDLMADGIAFGEQVGDALIAAGAVAARVFTTIFRLGAMAFEGLASFFGGLMRGLEPGFQKLAPYVEALGEGLGELGAMFVELGEAIVAALGELELFAASDQTEALVDMAEAGEQVGAAIVSGLTAAAEVASAVFGALISIGAATYEALVGFFSGFGESFAAAFEGSQLTLLELKAAFLSLMEELGPAALELIDAFKALFGLASEDDSLLPFIMALGSALGSAVAVPLRLVFEWLAMTLRGVMTLVKFAIWGFRRVADGVAFLALGIADMAAPLQIVWAAGEALFDSFTKWASDKVGPAMAAIKAHLVSVGEAVTATLVRPLDMVVAAWASFKEWIGGLAGELGEFFAGLGGTIGSALGSAVSGIGSAAAAVWQSLSEGLAGLGPQITAGMAGMAELFEPLAKAMGAMFGSPLEALKTAWQGVYDFVAGLLDKLGEKVAGAFKPATDFVASTVDSARNSAVGKFFGLGTEDAATKTASAPPLPDNVVPFAAPAKPAEAELASQADQGLAQAGGPAVSAVALPAAMRQAPALAGSTAGLAAQASVSAAQSTTAAVQAGPQGGASDQPIVVNTNLTVDGQTLARTVNRVNAKRSLSQGGQQ